MRRSVRALQRCAVRAADGKVGCLRDFYFDDEMWVVRYLVVDGAAMPRRRNVVISPRWIGRVDMAASQVVLSVTCRQIADSSDADLHKPVSRQHQGDLLTYYGYPYYWAGASLWGVETSYLSRATAHPPHSGAPETTTTRRTAQARQSIDDRRLRSTMEVIDYHVQANDGDLGHIDDFLVDDGSWKIRHAVIDTSDWWFGRKVLVSPEWITGIDWASATVTINRSRDSLKRAGAYDPETQIEDQRPANDCQPG